MVKLFLVFTASLFFLIACHASFIRTVGPKLTESALLNFKCSEKIVALTIDDGPDEKTTKKILDVLNDNGSSATFFIIGNRAEPELLKAIVESGSELGNHGFSEEQLTNLEKTKIRESISRTHAILSEYQDIKWFRPAKGRYNNSILEEISKFDYRLVLADVYPYDHLISSTRFHDWYIQHSIKSGSIIVLHDFSNKGVRTIATLQKVLPAIKRKGYKVVSLSQMELNEACKSG